MIFFRACALALLLLGTTGANLFAAPDDDRSLGMAITLPERGDFETALTTAINAGVTRIPITFSWRDLEPEPGIYDDRSLALAALLLPAMGVAIDLAITPIANGELDLPRDLNGRSLDDPEVIQRYLAMLDHALAVLAGAGVEVLLLGVEIDRWLGDDAQAWDTFAVFTTEVSNAMHDHWPDIEIGVQSSTWSRMQQADRWTAIDAVTDIIATSYYPLDGYMVRDPADIADDFDRLTTRYPDRPIRIVEAGFPSSEVAGSSPDLQAEFIQALFAAWDTHATQIRSITLWTAYDYAPRELGQMHYSDERKKDPALAVIGSLGLREWDGAGSPKPAWDVLVRETERRGWQS